MATKPNPKTSKAAKITRRPMESGDQTTIRTPKAGSRTSYMGTIKTQKGRTTTKKYSSGTKEVSTKIPKKVGKTVTKTTESPKQVAKKSAEGPKQRKPASKTYKSKRYSHSIGNSDGWSNISHEMARARAVKKAAVEGPKKRTPVKKAAKKK